MSVEGDRCVQMGQVYEMALVEGPEYRLAHLSPHKCQSWFRSIKLYSNPFEDVQIVGSVLCNFGIELLHLVQSTFLQFMMAERDFSHLFTVKCIC